MVIALDKNKRPLGFITERRFRKLCEQKRAMIYRVYPCIAIIKDIDSRKIDGLSTFRIKIDPGSKHTGIAIVCNETNKVMLYMQIEHRGDIVKANVPEKYKHHGKMTGRIAIRKTGNFDIWPIEGKRCNVKSCFCKSLQKKDGYSYKYTAL